MYTILYRSRMESWGVNETVDASGTDPGRAIAGALLSVINSASSKHFLNQSEKKITSNGLSNKKFRDCFLDMDNGDIIFY
jgi:hypothetical protein